MINRGSIEGAIEALFKVRVCEGLRESKHLIIDVNALL